MSLKHKIGSGLAIVGLALSLGGGVAMAQDTAQSTDPNEPAVYFSDRNQPLAELTVTAVDPDFQEYSEFNAPEDGYRYVAVNVDVEVVGQSSITLNRYYFTMFTESGRNETEAYVSLPEESSVRLLTEEITLASGETGSYTLVYQLPEDVEPLMLMWQPDTGVILTFELDGVEEDVIAGDDAGATPAVDAGEDVDATPAAND